MPFTYEHQRDGVWYDNSGDGLRILHSCHEGGFAIPRYHMHTTHEIHIAVTGQTEIECGTLTASMRAPYVAVHRPYIPHRLNMVENTGTYSRFILNFTEEFLSHALEWTPAANGLFSCNFLAFELTPVLYETIRPHLEDAFQLFENRRYDACRLAIALTLDDLASALPQSRIVASGGNQRYLDEVIRYIITHIGDRLTCGEVATQFFVSESKLAHDFKRNFGVAFNQYILQLRVKTAKDMLAHGVRVVDATKACGFCDSSYFIRVFKSFTGQTPGEFASSNRHDGVI